MTPIVFTPLTVVNTAPGTSTFVKLSTCASDSGVTTTVVAKTMATASQTAVVRDMIPPMGSRFGYIPDQASNGLLQILQPLSRYAGTERRNYNRKVVFPGSSPDNALIIRRVQRWQESRYVA